MKESERERVLTRHVINMFIGEILIVIAVFGKFYGLFIALCIYMLVCSIVFMRWSWKNPRN